MASKPDFIFNTKNTHFFKIHLGEFSMMPSTVTFGWRVNKSYFTFKPLTDTSWIIQWLLVHNRRRPFVFSKLTHVKCLKKFEGRVYCTIRTELLMLYWNYRVQTLVSYLVKKHVLNRLTRTKRNAFTFFIYQLIYNSELWAFVLPDNFSFYCAV